ncbi:clavesin-2 [Nephila pilipes]|uniref:Clavesin-2 n=1 Tax=Nephila pilipes TaxID=299642 RepID=A0A8X6TXU6_NEPPI|nr:clavesin-2 [Nephila pilipes]
MAPLLMWAKGSTPYFAKIAEEELGETCEVREKCLAEVKKRIEEEPNFQPLMDEEFLIRFLRAKKYNVDRAFNTLKNYYSFKSRYSGIVTDFTPHDLKFVFEMDKVLVSPKRARNGEGILIVFIGSFDIDKCTIEQHLAASLIGAEIGMETEGSQVCGSHCVIDMQGMTFRKLKHYFQPSFVSLVARCIQDSMPYRIIGIHFVHEPSYFGAAYNVIKPLLSKKLRNRMHFHSDNLESLHEYLPPETLPEELGGYLGKKDFQEFRSMMMQNNDLVDRLNTYVFEGNKSPNQSNNSQAKQDVDPNATTRTLFNVSTS